MKGCVFKNMLKILRKNGIKNVLEFTTVLASKSAR